MSRLPASIQEIADVIGRDDALYLVGQLPTYMRSSSRDQGARWRETILYVPKTLKPDHTLVRILGYNQAARLVAHFGGEILKPANCQYLYRAFRDEAIIRMAREGQKPAAVAAVMDVSERRVRGLLQVRTIPREEFPREDNDNARIPTEHAHKWKNPNPSAGSPPRLPASGH